MLTWAIVALAKTELVKADNTNMVPIFILSLCAIVGDCILLSNIGNVISALAQ